MRKAVFLLVLALIAPSAAPGGDGSSPAAAAAPNRAKAVLAIVGQERRLPRLVRLDTTTLRPLRGRAVPLGGIAAGFAFSPTGNRLAVGGNWWDGLRVVDLRRMQLLGRKSFGDPRSYVEPLAWPAPRRLVVLNLGSFAKGDRLLVVDPVTRQVLSATPLHGFTGVGAPTRGGYVFLFVAGQERALGVGVIDTNGNVRTVTLDRIRDAGEALAVDPVGGHAYVVGADDLVAEIDVETLAVSYHELSQPQSLLGRLFAWLDPAAQAKSISGPVRTARWLGGGLIAVTGSNSRSWVDASGERRTSEPAGLELIDTRTWTVRMVDERIGWFVHAGGLLLAGGVNRDDALGTERGMGVAAYGLDGELRWRLLGSEPIARAQAGGGYAYIPKQDSLPQRVRVIDVTVGRVVRVVQGDMPWVVARDG